MTDWDLLQNYAKAGSDGAFKILVERYLNLVHSVAVREVGDANLAQEVSQAVFLLLAQKAASLKRGIVLSGWLFRTTRFVAARARRAEQRRRQREQEAYEMQRLTTADETWSRIGPKLDEALEQLGGIDRDLLLLRFYEGRNHKEAGAALGLGEEAARKRGARALDKLRGWFAGRGITLTAAALATAISANAVQAAPVRLARGILAATATNSGSALPQLVLETLRAWRRAKAGYAALYATSGLGLLLLFGLTIQHVSARRTLAGVRADTGVPPSLVAVSQSSNSSNLPLLSSNAGKRNSQLRLHVIDKVSREPVALAQVVVRKVPDWTQTYDQFTDERGICDIPLNDGLARLDVGLLASGWGARFLTWKDLDADPIPSEYTLEVEQVTNAVGGWLRDSNGKPVSNATVWLQFVGTGDASWRETPRERVGIMEDAPVATSDSFGHWSCAVIPVLPKDNPGFSIKAVHAEFSDTQIASYYPFANQDEDKRDRIQKLWAGTLVTTLNQPLEIRGRVTDEAGQPIGRARVDHSPTAMHPVQLQTESNGSFVIPKLNPGKFGFAISSEGFAPEYREIDVKPGLEPVNIALKTGGVLRLRVLDESGVPVPDTTVGMEQWGEHRFVLTWEVKSGDDGRIVWNSAPRDSTLEIFAHKNGWCYSRNIKVTADAEEHVITMKPALRLRGYVTDAQTGAAVEDFKVIPGYGEGRGEQVWDRNNSRPGTNGRFNLVFQETRQPWQLKIEADGYEPLFADPLRTNKSGIYEVALKRAEVSAGIRGVVLLPDGSPAANANVALLSLDYGASLWPGKFREEGFGNLTNTDESGNFAFAANPRAHSVAAVNEVGYVKLRVRNSSQPVTLRLQAWGTIEGTISESVRSLPIEYVTVYDETAFNYRGSVAPDINAFQAKPDPAGHFVFKRVPRGRYSLYINRQTGTAMVFRTPVEVRPGETTPVTIGDTGRTVVGRLILPTSASEIWKLPGTYAALNPKSDGNSAPPQPPTNGEDAGLWAVDFWQSQAARDYYDRNHTFSLSVVPDGSFRAEGVPPGTYQLFVVAGRASLKKDITIPESQNRVEPFDLGTFPLSVQ